MFSLNVYNTPGGQMVRNRGTRDKNDQKELKKKWSDALPVRIHTNAFTSI